VRQLRLLSLTGNSSPPCVASRHCGVCIVAHWLFADSGRVGARLPKFLPPSCPPQVLLSLQKTLRQLHEGSTR